MDIAEQTIRTNQVKDQVGERCQKLFQDFLEEFMVDGEQKYLPEVQELIRPERNTLSVSFEDIEKYNHQLATTILEEYYRVYPFLCRADRNYAKDWGQIPSSKEFYVSLTDVSIRVKVRELTTMKIATLLRLTRLISPEKITTQQLLRNWLDTQVVDIELERDIEELKKEKESLFLLTASIKKEYAFAHLDAGVTVKEEVDTALCDSRKRFDQRSQSNGKFHPNAID